MTNQIRPVQFNNGSDTCSKPGFNCQNIYSSEFPNTQFESGDSTNIAYREVKNMTNFKSKLRIFGMIITVPMVFMASINPVLSISLSQQLERENGQYKVINSRFSQSSEANDLDKFVTSSYYSKDCRRRNVCDD